MGRQELERREPRLEPIGPPVPENALSTGRGASRGNAIACARYCGAVPKDPRAAVVAELDELLASSQEVRRRLVEAEKSYRRARRLVDQGEPMGELLSTVGAGKVRSEVSDALDRLERARHASRRSFVVAGQAEGMSLGQMGRLWGFSRQLAARYAAEARAEARRRPGARRAARHRA